jgi:predicted transcriptional regulator
VPQAMWKQHLAQIPEHAPARLSFMTDAHHQVRNFVVVEVVLRQQPLEPKYISESLNLPVDQVTSILDELEKKLTFLVRNAQGAVSWAYPVTVEATPHRLNFDSGEQLYAA